jgi:hypothetical protein
VAINDVAKSVTGGRRDDHISVKTLLESAKYLSANQLAVKATRMAAWNAFMGSNGIYGSRNLVVRAMFDNDNIAAATGGRPTTATAMGEVRVPTRGKTTFVSHRLAVCNACPELRGATTRGKGIEGSNNAGQTCAHLRRPQN